MISAELETRVISTIARSQKLALDTVNLDSTFEELGIDSLGGIELVFELESEFSVEIPDAQARSMRSVREAVEGMRSLLAGGSPVV